MRSADFKRMHGVRWKRELPVTVPLATDPSADVYSAAIVLKEVFCRNGPFTEIEENLTNKGLFFRFNNKLLSCSSSSADDSYFHIQIS